MISILMGSAYVIGVVAARVVSWWFCKPYQWGEEQVASGIIAWSKAEHERAIREWD